MNLRNCAFVIAVTIVLAAGTLVPAAARERILITRGAGRSTAIATSLFIANADGTGERRLLPTSGFDYSPSFSADGNWIVFTSERNGPANIFRAHADGSGLERLTDNPSFDDQAMLSHDGRKLAFVSTRDSGSADVWALDLASRKLRNITHHIGRNFRPAWSPDGKWLAFSSDRDTQPGRRSPSRFEQVQLTSVYIVRSDGHGPKRISALGVYAGSPGWSEDGRQVLFYEMSVEQAFDARFAFTKLINATSKIVSVDVSTGARSEIVTGDGIKVAPQYVNGEIAYSIKEGEHAGLAYSRHGSGTAGDMRNPSWSPDGRQVVYQKYDTQPQVQNQPLYSKYGQDFEFAWSNPFPAFSRDGRLAVVGDFRGLPTSHGSLNVMDADGSHAQRIFEGKDGGVVGPAWSPDGQWIAFGFGVFFNQGKPARIMIVQRDGSGARALTEGSVNGGFPSFSTDGEQIVYRVWGAENGLRVMSLATGSIRILTTEQDNFPAWSPTENTIEFTRSIGDGFDIFSIRSDGTGLQRLTTAPGNDAHGVWSPDGKHILFSSARLGFKDESPLYDVSPQPYAELFIMNADGSDQKPLTDNKWEDGTPAWQPSSISSAN
jgi:Tol biopolymer transport system component